MPAAARPVTTRSKPRRRRSIKARARLAAKKAAAPAFRKLMVQDDRLVDAKPSLPRLDPLEAAQEEARHAKEGNLKLARAVEALRTGLETIVFAEVDNHTRLPVNVRDLKEIAVNTLDAYSALVGQSWRTPKNKLSGASRAGRAGNQPVHEANMRNRTDAEMREVTRED